MKGLFPLLLICNNSQGHHRLGPYVISEKLKVYILLYYVGVSLAALTSCKLNWYTNNNRWVSTKIFHFIDICLALLMIFNPILFSHGSSHRCGQIQNRNTSSGT
jgi:hypothetical protein